MIPVPATTNTDTNNENKDMYLSHHFSHPTRLTPPLLSCDAHHVNAQACILRKVLKSGVTLSPDNLPELRIVLHDSLLAAENLTPPFMRALARQGWQTEKIVVEAHRRRARWWQRYAACMLHHAACAAQRFFVLPLAVNCDL
jgi:hypothetical protein